MGKGRRDQGNRERERKIGEEQQKQVRNGKSRNELGAVKERDITCAVFRHWDLTQTHCTDC